MYGRHTTELLKALEASASSNVLNVEGLDITHLPPLSSTLQELRASASYLETLPPLPASLRVLGVEGMECLSSLPDLPEGLEELWCQYSTFQLPSHLPNSLRVLSIGKSGIRHLPPLPPCLERLTIDYNMELTELPPLPASLKYLDAMFCKLAVRPPLPDGIEVCLFQGNPCERK